MHNIQKYIPFFLSALLMCVVLCIIYPHYQYYIDPDGTAYLTISKRYAIGDYHRAINGYWSPWSCWLTALLIKTGLSPIPASVIINAIGATGFLYISQSFFLKFNITRRLQWLMCITLAFFLCYAVFAQSFDDLWECFFLLSTLRIMLSARFKEQPALWVAMGLIGTLAYFAKAYSFPFFILNTICCTYFICKNNKAQWLKISATAIGVMVICGLPWIWLVHSKYGIWTTSTAGTLNMSWYLEGHPHWKEGIKVLLPPVYNDSPSYWEDPWYVNGATPHFWDSWHLLGLQFLRAGLNVWKFIVSSLQLSVFFIVIVGCVKWLVIWKRRSGLDIEMSILMISFLLFPVGYLLVNFESRYIWYMLPLGMVSGGAYFSRNNVGWKRMLLYVFAASFLIYPAWQMVKMYDEGKHEYELAKQLKSMSINGSFASSAHPGKEIQRARRFAYFSGMQLYDIPNLSATKKKLLDEMNRYHVNYFFYYGNAPHERFEITQIWQPCPELTNNNIAGLEIFEVNQK